MKNTFKQLLHMASRSPSADDSLMRRLFRSNQDITVKYFILLAGIPIVVPLSVIGYSIEKVVDLLQALRENRELRSQQ